MTALKMVERRLLEIECQLLESRIARVSASTAFMAELVEEARQSGKTVYRDGNRFSFSPYVGVLRVHLDTRLPENTFIIALR
jgi:hypothetical protein